jgi:ABC-2 type transport system ATP-binding protein
LRVTKDFPVWADTITKKFGKQEAVKGVSLQVPQGQIYGVLGPNGAGKTTTLRMLLGIIEPDSGSRGLLGHSVPRKASDRVGYLPEERGLYPSMKARETIAFMGALRGLDWAEGRKRAGDMMEDIGLGHALDKKIKQMSKGMAQLVQLIGSVVHKPELIVLDEPFSGLDPVNQEHLERLIRAEQSRGATILFSTHVMGHAERLCDHLSVIVGGLVRFDGTVDTARSMLPMQAHYAPAQSDAEVAAILPPDAHQSRSGWSFTVPENGVEEILTKLIKAKHGIAGLTMQRPSLHDAFVKIVREAGGTVDLDEEIAA